MVCGGFGALLLLDYYLDDRTHVRGNEYLRLLLKEKEEKKALEEKRRQQQILSDLETKT